VNRDKLTQRAYMKTVNRFAATFAVLCAAVTIQAQTGNVYLQTNLVSNVKGLALVTDPNLVDPWGISFSATSPFWTSNHLSGTSTLYNGQGTISPIVVTILAAPGSAPGTLGRPTGQVRNGTAGVFKLANGNAASFIFATEDGTIQGWNGGTVATITADDSASKAVYKGLAIGTSAGGPTLYAANFRSGKIDVFNSNWAPTALAGDFSDPVILPGYAPFNIWNLNNQLYVTYAKQDANKFLDVAGPGNGYVSIFDLNGNLVKHFADDHSLAGLFRGPVLNSPWGVAIAPANWGAFGGAVLVGNFGDGKILAYNATNGNYLGMLKDAAGNPIAISGLWAIAFGNGGNGGDLNTLYFLAGQPNGSSVARGILGSIAPPAAITSVVSAASQIAGAVAPGELVRISGQTVGPSPAVSAKIPPASALDTSLGGSTITVGGIAAPILYTNGGQTNIQIPYGIAGSTTADVVLTLGPAQGGQTAKITLQVAPTAPGIFTFDFSGIGRMVALNSDGSLNSAANPAARGSSLMFFATGAGVTNPADMDGRAETDTSRVPVAPLSVTIGGLAATLGVAGSTPKDVAGVLQVMVTVPTNIPAGSANVVLTAGGVATTQATFIYVK
jgi:uncharacterized protein (TIGR03118 family)